MTKDDAVPTGERSHQNRQRWYNFVIWGPLVLVPILALVLNGFIGTDDLANGSVSPTRAFIVLFVMAAMLPVIRYQHRLMDEHDERSFIWSGHIGFGFMCFAGMAWDVLHKAAMLPPLDFPILAISSLIVATILWLWLKYR
jgi:hypothetical protein